MNLYWHKDLTGRHVGHKLTVGPRYFDPPIAFVSFNYQEGKRWRVSLVDQRTFARIENALVGSPAAAKRWAEREINKRSIGLLNVDDVIFHSA